MTEEQKPQAGAVQEVEQAGEETPQPAEQPEPKSGVEAPPQAEPKPGEEVKPQVEPKFTQEQWVERETEFDRQASELRNVASQATMQAQIAQRERAEANALAKDKSDIEQGVITEPEAQQRQQERQRVVQMQPQVEQMGRMMAAQDFGGRYGVNPYELLNDQSIRTPQQMDAKAKQLAQTKSDAEKKTVSDEIDALKAEIKALKEGEPLFDSGQQGAGAPDLTGKSPLESAQIAYSDVETSRRKREKKK